MSFKTSRHNNATSLSHVLITCFSWSLITFTSMYPAQDTFDANAFRSGYIEIKARSRDRHSANENRIKSKRNCGCITKPVFLQRTIHCLRPLWSVWCVKVPEECKECFKIHGLVELRGWFINTCRIFSRAEIPIRPLDWNFAAITWQVSARFSARVFPLPPFFSLNTLHCA